MSQRRYGAMVAYANILLKNLISFMYIPILLKFVGGNQYGLYQMTSSAVGMLSLLSLGMSASYVRFFWQAKRRDGDEGVSRINSAYLSFFLLISVVCLAAGGVLTNNVEILFQKNFSESEIETTKMLMVILSVNVAVTLLSSVFDSYIIANEKYLVEQLRVLFSTLLQPVFSIILLIGGGDIVAVATVQLLVTLIFIFWNMIYAVSRLKMKFKFTNIRNLVETGKNILPFSGVILINQIIDLVNNNFSTLLVGNMLGPMSVAVFAIANQLKGLFYQLTFTISRLYVSKVHQMISFDATDGDLTNLMIKIGRIQLYLLVSAFGLFVVLGQSFIEFWAGKDYGEAYWLVVLMMTSLLVPLSQNIGLEIQKAKNLHRFRIILMCFSTLFNLFASIIFIKKFGVLGAGIGFSISTVVVNVVVINIYNHKVVGLDMFKYWRKVSNVILGPGIAILLTVGFNCLFGGNSILKVMIDVILYGTLTLLIHWIFSCDENERKIITSSLNGLLNKAILRDKGVENCE
ncbi:lipopolysaccharide biosynthesis protein [Weissella cibaria]|uniref:lipopolysaccharide biosynthesis protein n=1 Tax=Weissella cibaria TaxID=137591 RepID=UPI0021B06641|nr:oligosaccharide flippase family protein [Weissella cibaria]MCT0011369.1 hypothetical protein [Weissella cibaria]MCT0950954.1 hypothetical protein [Weissella cibaria]